MELTPKQEMFVKEYLVDLNATQAAIRAGYSERTARKIGQENLTKPDIQAAIQKAMDERSARTDITADKVLKRWWDIATADPNEIIHLRRTACRRCYGVNHEYQWKDEAEFEEACANAVELANKLSVSQDKEVLPVMPSNAGGYGYDPLDYPNDDCPKCLGEGNADIHINDTRRLRGSSRLLYAGIKQTNTGIEIKMRDQDKALENVARHLGMYNDKVDVTGEITIKVAMPKGLKPDADD